MARTAAEATGTLAQALDHARRLLGRDPAMAAQQASEILRVVPGSVAAHRLLGTALGLQGRHREAITALARATTLDAGDAEAWRQLAGQLTAIGDREGAARATAGELQASTRNPALIRAALALRANDLPVAEQLLRDQLRQDPDDIAALRMLAELAARLGRFPDARLLLERALEIAPGFTAARHHLAIVLYRQQRSVEALAVLETLLEADPDNPAYRSLKAAVFAAVGELDSAAQDFAALLAERPNQPKLWMSYGHALKTVGRQAEAVTAYREAISRDPRLGEAWWSLANLKTVRFDGEDVAAMREGAARGDLKPEDALHFHFALGKALEDAGDAVAAFEHYAAGNRLRRQQLPFDGRAITRRIVATEQQCDSDFFAARPGGCPAPDPIFIIGMPRSGSTLIEQILASHSAIEGTQELPDIALLSRRDAGFDAGDYPATLAALTPEQRRALGEEFLERTRIQRKTTKPLFIDKMPNNWQHLAFIQLILPNARIIDARRHPLACGWSNFKQHFARGQAFAYDLADIGHYYASYVRLTAHVDRVLPGRIVRVFHEALLADPETEVRRLLAALDLDFEPACLKFHENARAVRTASSEQVRRPLNRDGVDAWKPFDPWLGPLREALGPVLTDYPFEG